MKSCVAQQIRNRTSLYFHRLPCRRTTCGWFLAALILSLPLASCARKESPRAGSRGEVAPVLVAQATRQDVPVTLRTIGTVEAYRSAAVRARVGGTLTRVHFREGQDVKEGAPLFSIDARPYAVALKAAEANLAGERAKAAIAAGNAERSVSLLDQNLVSQQEHERVMSAAQAESAAVRSLEASVENARLNLEFCSISAPISGRTSNLLVTEGNLVRANDDQALVVINQLAPIFVAFSVPQRSLPEIRQYMAEGPPLVVEASVTGASREPARGQLTFVNNAVDPTTGSILLKAEFPNEDLDLWPGEFVHVSVILTTRRGVLVVPASAVQSGQKGDYVLVVKSDQTAEMRPVTSGPRLDGKAIIESGLEPGETVVTDGHLRVVPGAKVAIKTGLESPGTTAEMNLPELCIRRPVMTSLVMLGILIFGIVGYRLLPVSNLPNVDFPTVSVSASLPGASPETMASTVATPLEKQFSTIAGISSMSSSSALGSTNITLQFDLSRDIDAAAQDVQAAIAAVHDLPKEMPSPPSYSKVNPADQPILFIALTSPTLPLSALDEYGETLLAQRISMVSGVAQVNVFGGQKYAVRIQLDPSALAAKGIGFDDVTAAIQRENVKLPTGTLYGPDQTFTIEAAGQLDEAEAFRSLIVAYRNGKPVRLEELGNVLDSVENIRTAAWYGDERSIFLVIQRQPGTNIVAVADAVKALMPTFRAKLPASVSMNILYDRSESIRASVKDVKFTLFLTLCLVVLIIFLFLRNLSATVIPSLALPMSIIGTFAIMYVFGYSLDNLSLMALTLSLGFVVDDAIVMLENIVRHMEKGEGVMEAALKGSREIGFTIISMTISLAAVFIPVLFMGGIIGRLFQEFAVTIMAAILISGVVSLSLTPMLCSRFLRHGKATHAAGVRDEPVLRRHGARLPGRADGLRAGTPVERAASPRRARLLDPDPRGHRGALPDRAHGIPAERGRGPDQRQHRGPGGDLLRADGAAPEGRGRHRRPGSQRRGDHDPRRRRRARRLQHRKHHRPAEAAEGAEALGGPAHHLAAAAPGRGPGNPGLPAEPASDQRRRPAVAKPVPDHHAGDRHRGAVPARAGLPGEAARPARPDRSQHRPDDPQPQGRRRDRPRAGDHPRGLDRADSADPLQRLRLAPDLLHLHADQRVPGHPRAETGVPGRRLVHGRALRPLGERNAGAPERGGDGDARARAAHRESLRADPLGDDLLQPEARRFPRAGRGRGRQAGPRRAASDHHDELPGNGAGVPVLHEGAGHAARGRGAGDLSRPGDPLRELHPSPDDPVRAPVRRLRRPRDAARLRGGPEHLLLRRRHHAGGAGQEERDHDGRLRAGGAAHGGTIARGGDPWRPA